MLPAAVPPPPAIVRHYIPYPARRKREMRAYARRHYGIDDYRLRAPEGDRRARRRRRLDRRRLRHLRARRPRRRAARAARACARTSSSAPTAAIVQMVPLSLMCRHTVGLNYTAIGIEHVGFRDADVLGNARELRASLRLTRWLRCRFGIARAGTSSATTSR